MHSLIEVQASLKSSDGDFPRSVINPLPKVIGADPFEGFHLFVQAVSGCAGQCVPTSNAEIILALIDFGAF